MSVCAREEQREKVFEVYGSIPRDRECVVFDVDGVLIDNSERLRRSLEEVGARDISELNGERRRRFWEIFLSEKYIILDKPNQLAIELAKKRKSEGYAVVVLTGRPMRLMKKTLEQLDSYGVPYDAVIFRTENNYTKDHEYKRKVIEELGLNVIELHDDSEQVCSACVSSAKNIYIWRNLRPEPYTSPAQLTF
ncbi:MAG: HAD family acid phosphatase [Ignisphaera sp.]